MSAVQEVEEAYEYYKKRPGLSGRADRPAGKTMPDVHPFYIMRKKMTRDLGGAKIYLKRRI